MTEYVLGFLFSPDLSKVVLINKERPRWQAGLINGIGGKVDPGEDAHTAMVREFREETGLTVEQWTQYASIGGPDAAKDYATGFKLHVFYATSIYFDTVTSITDEKVFWDRVSYIMERNSEIITVPNVRWLIQMALSFSVHGGSREGAKFFTITETY